MAVIPISLVYESFFFLLFNRANELFLQDSLKKCNFLSEDDLKRHRNIKRYAIETNSVYIKGEFV